MADKDEEVMPRKPMLVLGAGGFVGSAVAKAFAAVEAEEGWEVTGTLRAGQSKPKWVSHVAETSEQKLSEAIARSSVIVLDLVSEPALSEQVLQLLATSSSEEEKVVIGVSTIMTWARTSLPVEEEEADKGLTEDEYKRRRPHVNFSDQHTLEKLLVRSKTDITRTAVICAGLLYGGAEDLFHPLFKKAWQNESLPLLSLSGEGGNILPTIHIEDLCSVILKVADGEGPPYIVAVDQAEGQTLKQVTEAIAKQLGNGQVTQPSKEEIELDADVDYFNLNLKITPVSVDAMGIEWVSQSGFAKNAAKVVAEFRKARGLEPLKLLMLGPLAGIGGSLEGEVAAAIAKEYKVAHLTAAYLIAEATSEQSELSDKVRAAKAADKANTGVLPDELMAQLLRRKLNSAVCTNQGWVLDGYPQTLPQLKLIAPEKADDEEEEAAAEEEEGEEAPKPPADLTPESVLVVNLTADRIKARVQAMSQQQVEATGMTAEQLTKRMTAYAATSAPEGPHNPLLHKAMKELESLELDTDADPLETMLARARLYLGKPRNYGPTEAEVLAKAERLAAVAAEEGAKAKQLEDAQLQEEMAAREVMRAADGVRIADRVQHEKALLEARSAPLRAYLMSEVIPTLTEGLIEVTKVRVSK